MAKEINGAFIGGGLCSVIGLGSYAVLAEHGIRFTSFSGASIGSLIAICLAAGKSPQDIRDFLAENVEAFCVPILGHKRIRQEVNQFLEGMYFEDLPAECIVSISPFNKRMPSLITRDNAGKLTCGDVAWLSSSLPGLFLPGYVKLDGKRSFVLDGGLAYNPPLNEKPHVVNYLFSFKRSDDPPKHSWDVIKLRSEAKADHVLNPRTTFGTLGKHDDVLKVYAEGRQATIAVAFLLT